MLIDVSMPITAGSVFRLGTPPVEIALRRFYHESEGEYESVVLSLSAHTATHVDLVFAENRIEPERMIGRGKLIVVTQVSGSEIQLDDVEHQACPEPCPEQGRRESRRVEIESGDFVFFRTDWSKLVGTEEYHNHPELSPEVVKWLVSKRINAVGIDARGLGRGRRHGENGGVWMGERIISEKWVEESTKKHASPSWADGYGYQWWLKTYHAGSTSVDSFYAAGWGGQRIMVFPSLDMVVVFTGGNYVGDEPVDEIITRYILPAVR